MDLSNLLHSNQVKQDTTVRDLLFTVFSTEKGREALRLFRERTIERPVIPTHVSDGTLASIEINARLGENRFVQWIEQTVKKGEDGL